jgi:hypothetical protein
VDAEYAVLLAEHVRLMASTVESTEPCVRCDSLSVVRVTPLGDWDVLTAHGTRCPLAAPDTPLALRRPSGWPAGGGRRWGPPKGPERHERSCCGDIAR